MNPEEKKYEEILNLLKKSSPELHDKGRMTDQILDTIENRKLKINPPDSFFDYLFWWVNIGWVRRSLVIVSILIVMIFGYQQTIILKRLSDLSRQPVLTGNQMVIYSSLTPWEDYLFMINDENFNSEKLKISDRRVKRLVKSCLELTNKYKELQKIIEEEPDLKKYVEENLYHDNKNRIKI
jgi:hypothetical protein